MVGFDILRVAKMSGDRLRLTFYRNLVFITIKPFIGHIFCHSEANLRLHQTLRAIWKLNFNLVALPFRLNVIGVDTVVLAPRAIFVDDNI